jgi:hypothetical protein
MLLGRSVERQDVELPSLEQAARGLGAGAPSAGLLPCPLSRLCYKLTLSPTAGPLFVCAVALTPCRCVYVCCLSIGCER